MSMNMKTAGLLLAGLALSACSTLADIEESILGPLPPETGTRAADLSAPYIVPSSTSTVAPGTPTEAIASASAADWRTIDSANLLLMDLAGGRRVAIELAPAFAPVHVANIRAFARASWWAKSGIYRVQDNYVAQWGNGETTVGLPAGVVGRPPAEYDRELGGQRARPLGSPDAYAPAVGHLAGWPVAWNPRNGRVNMVHCYGAVGVGRGEAPDTGTGGELYAVIGHSPRHLDRNIALVGRVVDGMDALSARPRGTEALGFYKLRSSDIPIVKVSLASDLPPASRPVYQVLDTYSAAFGRYVTARANRRDAFFAVSAGGVDICNAPVPTRKR